jgi:DNA-binding Lrp family transcriptional regulator
MSKSINIRPTTSVYATYKNIRYDPWTAIAEFVDNSTQSYYDNIERLESTKYWDGLTVDIEYKRDKINGDRLIIRDDAYGMDFHDFKRAIMLDSPPKRKSRSEFGMGLKTAACWFGKCWSVESVALGSGVKYKATVDVEALSKYKNEEITVEEIPCSTKEHGTIVTIWNLNRTLSGTQIGKTKDQLRGMYRTDLRSGKIKILYNAVGLVYETPKVLTEILPDGSEKVWKKDIDISFDFNGEAKRVYGFIGILDEGSTSGAGFTLIRYGRVIVGGYENGYRPEEIFEKSNSYVYQRLFGELNLDGWRVTQTKDAFDLYGGLEDILIEKLKDECEDYRKKAKEYRKRPKVSINTGIETLVNTFSNAGVIDNAVITPIPDGIEINPSQLVIDQQIEESTVPSITTPDPADIEIEGANGKRIVFSCNGEQYIFNFILKKDAPNSRWLNIVKSGEEYIIEWNIRHMFFKPYINDEHFLTIMEQFTFALALSEIEAMRLSVDGKIDPSSIRTRMNETLKAVIMEGQ